MATHVLGLGETLDSFIPDGGVTIGVNDIYSRYPADYVVCVDSKRAFSKERIKTIENTRCKGFYTQVDEWKGVFNYRPIELATARYSLDEIDSEKFPYSISSPFVTCVLAYKMEAKNIVLWGVDFMSHPEIKDERRERALKDFKALSELLRTKGVQMYVGDSFSYLSTFLPTWTGKTGT